MIKAVSVVGRAVEIGGSSKKVKARGTLSDRSLTFLLAKTHFTGN